MREPAYLYAEVVEPTHGVVVHRAGPLAIVRTPGGERFYAEADRLRLGRVIGADSDAEAAQTITLVPELALGAAS